MPGQQVDRIQAKRHGGGGGGGGGIAIICGGNQSNLWQ
ncbi:hypothetical protein VTJ04DRAFT_8918 [Mycothermus thermophilus]